MNVKSKDTPESNAVESRGSSLTDIAYQKIRDAIVYAKLDLGEPLSENELAKALDMSKAPVRAAISQLRQQGLVVVLPQSGSYVFRPSEQEIKELCDFRYLLEERAMQLAMKENPDALITELSHIYDEMKASLCENDLARNKLCDSRFHRAFVKHSHNQFLESAYEDVIYKVEALRYRYVDTANFRNKGIDEHRRIVELLAEGKLKSVSRILESHIERTKEMQSGVRWFDDKVNRSDYKHRDYKSIF